MTIDDVMEHHARLIDEARAIARTFTSCRTAEEVQDTMLRFAAAKQRAQDYIDKTIEMMRAAPGNLPRA